MFEKCDGLSSHGEREHKYLCCCLLAGAASVTTRDEINDAVRKLALSREQFMEVPKVEAKSLFDRFLTQFTGGVDGRWWWEHFTHPTSEVRFDDGCGFKRISDVVPNPDENV
jgi:hypothetical protein